jgi:hypothetical protein
MVCLRNAGGIDAGGKDVRDTRSIEYGLIGHSIYTMT